MHSERDAVFIGKKEEPDDSVCFSVTKQDL